MEGSLSDMKQRPVLRKPPHFQNLPGEDNVFAPHERQGLPRSIYGVARPAIWLTSRMMADELTAMSEGDTMSSVEGALVTPFAASNRPRSIFTSDDVIPLSLRGPLVISSNPPTSVVVCETPEISNGIHAIVLKDHAPRPPTPTPTHIDSGERPWQIEKILRRRRARGSRRRGKQCLVEWTPSWLTLAEAEIAEKKWNIINILQTRSSETRGGSGLQEKVKIQWEPSWVSDADWVS